MEQEETPGKRHVAAAGVRVANCIRSTIWTMCQELWPSAI